MKGTKICRVCGKEYEMCHTQRPNLNNEFRYQEVACSPECGAIYLARILESRGIAPEPKVSEAAEPAKTEDITADSIASKKNTRKKKDSNE